MAITPGGKLRLRVWLSVFLDLIAFTAILPHFPALIKQIGSYRSSSASYVFETFAGLLGMPSNHPLHYLVVGGLVGTVLSLGSFLSGPLFGYLADKTFLGRRYSILITMGISLVAHIGMTLYTTDTDASSHLILFLVLRFLTGVGKSNVSLAVAILDDVALEEKTRDDVSRARKKGVAMIGVAYAIGFLVGPPLSVLVVRRLNVSHSVWSSVTQALSLLFTMVCIPETRRDRREDSKPILISLPHINTVAQYTVNPFHLFSPAHNLVPIAIHIVYFFFLVLYSSAEFSITFLQHTLVKASTQEQAYSYMCVGIVMILVQGGYVRRTKRSSYIILLQGLISFVIALSLFSFYTIQPSKLLFYTSLSFMGFSSATVVSSMTTLALQIGQEKNSNVDANNAPIVISALISSRLRSAGHLARACGPFVGSLWFGWWGATTFYWMHAGCLLLLILYTIRIQKQLQ